MTPRTNATNTPPKPMNSEMRPAKKVRENTSRPSRSEPNRNSGTDASSIPNSLVFQGMKPSRVNGSSLRTQKRITCSRSRCSM